MDQRLLGQDVEVLIVNNGTPLTNITAVRSLEATFKFEKKEEGYLGETTDRYDEVYKGIDGKLDFHLENADSLALVGAIRDRARNRRSGIKINVKATFNFPNGSTPRLVFRDIHFGDIPLSFGSRADYGMMSVPWSCDDAKVV
jgi:hypothetical protein